MAQHRIPPVASATAALLDAYLAARYRFEHGGAWWPLAIGQPEPAALARAWPSRTRTLLTAWNPQSVVRSAAANAGADAALRSQLHALGMPILPAVASDLEGRWNERGWLAAGLEATVADALASQYGQAGILHWRHDEPVRLRMYHSCPPGRGGRRWVDWVHIWSP